MAVSPPPRKSTAVKSEPDSSTRSKLDDKKIDAIINRGSSSVVASPELSSVKIKNFNVRLTADTLASIDELRAKRPRKPTSPKLGISTQDWILEAITEKLERERKKFK